MSDEPRLVQKLSLRERRCHQQEQSMLSTDPESLVQARGHHYVEYARNSKKKFNIACFASLIHKPQPLLHPWFYLCWQLLKSFYVW